MWPCCVCVFISVTRGVVLLCLCVYLCAEVWPCCVCVFISVTRGVALLCLCVYLCDQQRCDCCVCVFISVTNRGVTLLCLCWGQDWIGLCVLEDCLLFSI